MKPSDPNDAASVAGRSRRRRMRLFCDWLRAHGVSGGTLLDVGGTRAYWKMFASELPQGSIARIDVVNLPDQVKRQSAAETSISGIPVRFIAADVTRGDAPELDAVYDVVHSVSVLEHVGDAAAQRRMAERIRALGRLHWVQTPAKEFPLEAHFYLPFFAYWPLKLRAFVNWRFTTGVMPRHRDWSEALAFCRGTRLLTLREFSGLFPDSDVWIEWLCLFPKCYIAYTGCADGAGGGA